MSKEIPCPKCGHVWLWVDWKKDKDAFCPKGHGCASEDKITRSDDLVKRLMMRLQEIYDRPHDFSNGQKSEAAGLARDRIEELEAKLDKAVETLEFYGDERNYESEYIPDECGCCGSWYEPKIHKDGQDSGDKARTTLAEITSSVAANGEAKGGEDV